MVTGEALTSPLERNGPIATVTEKDVQNYRFTNILEHIHDILDAIHWGVLCHPWTVKSECSYRFPAEELSLMIIDVGQLGSISHHISHTWLHDLSYIILQIVIHPFIIICHLSLSLSLLSLSICELLHIYVHILIYIYTCTIHTYIYIHIHTSK